jgi:hypothetical protein
MMARGHVLTGAVAGVVLAGALAPTPWSVRVAALIITTGSALLPDIDSRRATITRVLGPLGWFLHHFTVWFGKTLYLATRTEYDDESPGSGHRLISHTYLAACWTGGMTGMATWGMPAWLLSTAGDSPWGQLAGVVGTALGTAVGDWWWCWALAVGIGHAAGVLGDTWTVSGAPCWFPMKIQGKRWYDARSTLPFHTDGITEHYVVTPLLCTALVAAVLGVLGWWPPIVDAVGGVVVAIRGSA